MNTEVGQFSTLSLRSPSFTTGDPGVPGDPLDLPHVGAKQLGNSVVGQAGLENEPCDFLVHSGPEQPQPLVIVERLHGLGFESRKASFN